MPGAFGAGRRLPRVQGQGPADALGVDAPRERAQEGSRAQKETKHAFQRIAELNRDAAEAGRAQFTENPVVAKFSAVEDLIRQLDPYYGS